MRLDTLDRSSLHRILEFLPVHDWLQMQKVSKYFREEIEFYVQFAASKLDLSSVANIPDDFYLASLLMRMKKLEDVNFPSDRTIVSWSFVEWFLNHICQQLSFVATPKTRPSNIPYFIHVNPSSNMFMSLHTLELNTPILSESVIQVMESAENLVIFGTGIRIFHQNELPFDHEVHLKCKRLERLEMCLFPYDNDRIGQWIGKECLRSALSQLPNLQSLGLLGLFHKF
jgi:hypothetical protein